MPNRILLADDHDMMRQGLRALLDNEADMTVVGEARDGREAVAMFNDLRPSVVVMDVAMPDMNGIEATKRIVAEKARAKVIALSMHSDPEFIRRMLEAGASGYLLKDCAFEEMIDAVRTVMENQVYLSPKVAGLVVTGYVHGKVRRSDPVIADLTSREREVLQMLAEGKTSKQIAATLDVSRKTVDTHRRNIMHKLDVYSVAELTKYAIREGLTSVDD